MGPDGHFGDFVEGLGPSQLVGRQVLGSPCLGEIQLGLFDRKGHLEVEVIRARGLSSKPGTKLLPGMLNLLSDRHLDMRLGRQYCFTLKFLAQMVILTNPH